MKCLQPNPWAVAVFSVAVLLVSPALASNNPLAGAMGNLRWGMRTRRFQRLCSSNRRS